MDFGRKFFIIVVIFFIGWYFILHKKPHENISANQQDSILKETKQSQAIISPRHPSTVVPNDQFSSTEGALEAFDKNSQKAWQVEWDQEHRFVKTLRLGSFHFAGGSLTEASNSFLQKYAKDFFGVDPANLRLQNIDDSADFKRVIYQEQIDGVPVYNSRLVLHYDNAGNLIHINADLYHEQNNDKQIDGAKIPEQVAYAQAWQSLPTEAKQDPKYSAPEKMQAYTKMEYLIFTAGGKATNIYRFVIALAPPLRGDYEVRIDAATGRTLYAAYLARN